MSYFSGAEVWQQVKAFGSCYASRNKVRALSLIATQPNSDDEVRVYKSLFHAADQSCLGLATELRVPHDMVRGAIAEGLLNRSIAPSDNVRLAPYEAGALIRSPQDFALCYAVQHPDAVRKLATETIPHSPQERAAIQEMAPDFSACLPQGVTAEFNATRIRYMLVEALYRSSPAPVLAGKN